MKLLCKVTSILRLVAAVTLFACASTVIAQTSTAPAKAKPPTAAQIAEALKLINDVYKDPIAKANTSEGKSVLAMQMLGDGANDKDLNARYALLTRARDMAAEAGDLRLSLKVIEGLDATYEIDRLVMAADVAAIAGKVTKEVASGVANEIALLMKAAVVAERFDLANKFAAAGMAVARNANIPAVTSIMTARTQAVRDAENFTNDGKKALETLKTKPADAPANLAAGKYYCFVRDDWDAGIPMIALGGDDALKAIASKEMNAPATSEAQLALADAWWAVAEKSSGLTRLASCRRAGKWYASALPEFSAGLTKSRVESRLKELADMEPPKPVDLLKLIDCARDAARGKWEMRDGQLLIGAEEQGRIQILYQPPEEYDFRIVFSRTGGEDGVMQFCFAAGKQFDFVVGAYRNTRAGFETVKGALLATNPTAKTLAAGWLVNGRRYTSVVKVRKDKVQAYLDYKLVAEWKTNYSDLALPAYYEMPRKDCLGLGAYSSPTIFYSAEIIEWTGKGKELK